MDDTIYRQAAIDAVNGLIDRFEQILRDIREANGDDSVCGMCEYDGAYIGQSGDWCNECPGFDKEDCFKLSDKCRKRWLKSVKLPSALPEPMKIDLSRCSEENWERIKKEWANTPITTIAAEPERIRGRWIEKPNVHGVAYCSLCDYELHTNDTNFCPNCGADMRGEQDE